MVKLNPREIAAIQNVAKNTAKKTGIFALRLVALPFIKYSEKKEKKERHKKEIERIQIERETEIEMNEFHRKYNDTLDAYNIEDIIKMIVKSPVSSRKKLCKERVNIYGIIGGRDFGVARFSMYFSSGIDGLDFFNSVGFLERENPEELEKYQIGDEIRIETRIESIKLSEPGISDSPIINIDYNLKRGTKITAHFRESAIKHFDGNEKNKKNNTNTNINIEGYKIQRNKIYFKLEVKNYICTNKYGSNNMHIKKLVEHINEVSKKYDIKDATIYGEKIDMKAKNIKDRVILLFYGQGERFSDFEQTVRNVWMST